MSTNEQQPMADNEAKPIGPGGVELAKPPTKARIVGDVIVTERQLRTALADVRENIGEQSQAAFAIEAIIKACE